VRASIDAATVEGAIEFEKRYGLHLFLNTSTTLFDATVKPPVPPPRALPRVELITSI